MFEFIVLIAALATLIAAIAYVRSMFKGQTKPNRVTWLMWTIAPFTAAFASFSSGATWAAVPVLMSGLSPFMILIASFLNKRAYWKLSAFGLCLRSLVGSGVSVVVHNREPQRSHSFRNFQRRPSSNTNPEKSLAKPRKRIPLAIRSRRIQSDDKFYRGSRVVVLRDSLPSLPSSHKHTTCNIRFKQSIADISESCISEASQKRGILYVRRSYSFVSYVY